jgi:hypothetical protein
MNVIVKRDLETAAAAVVEMPRISAAERARREASVTYARGSIRLEGFTLSPEVEELNRRYIDGELSSKELSAAILAHYTP